MLALAPLLIAFVPSAFAEDGAGEEQPREQAREQRKERRPRGMRRGGPPAPDGRDDTDEPEDGERAKMRERLRPFGLLQLWGTVHDQDLDEQADATGYGDPELDPGVSVKRVRVGIEGKDSGFDYTISFGVTAPYDAFDTETGAIGVVDAKVGYERAGLGIEAGRSQVPFSRDQMMSSSELTFTERGFGAEHIAPDRALGATVHAKRFGATITLGAFNSGGGLFGDDYSGKTLVGRVEYGMGGNPYAMFGPDKGITLGVGGGGFITDGAATRTTAVGGDVLFRVARVSILGDFSSSTIEPTENDAQTPGVWDPTTRTALTGQVSVGLGDFEPAVRCSAYADSSLGADGFDYTQVLGGVVWHGLLDARNRDRVRIGAAYVLRMEQTPVASDSVRLWVQLRP